MSRYARYVLLLHFLVAEVAALALLLRAGSFAEWIGWAPFDPVSFKLLGAAFAALGIGSLLAARDPLRHRVIVQTEIVYTAASAVVLLYRGLRFPDMTFDALWVGFAVFAAFCALFCLTYPRANA
jgi:hypothetical protein